MLNKPARAYRIYWASAFTTWISLATFASQNSVDLIFALSLQCTELRTFLSAYEKTQPQLTLILSELPDEHLPYYMSVNRQDILTVDIVYFIPFVSMYHTAKINVHSSRNDHLVARKKQSMSKIGRNPEQKFTIATSKPSLSIHLGMPKYSSRIVESMFFARRESW